MSGYYKDCKCGRSKWVDDIHGEGLCSYCESGESEEENDRFFREYFNSEEFFRDEEVE